MTTHRIRVLLAVVMLMLVVAASHLSYAQTYMLYLDVDIDQFEASLLARAGEVAIRQLRRYKHNSRVAAEYVKVLRALLRAHCVLTYEAFHQGVKKGHNPRFYDWESITQAQRNLRKEIENEEKK